MIIIMAAGQGSRWKDIRGVSTWYKQKEIPKQLAVVNGETIIERILRLIGDREYFITVPPNKRLPIEANQIEYPTQYEIDRFYPYKGQVTYLYGDVYYTEQAINKILTGSEGFYGKTKRKKGGKKAKELFAVKGEGSQIQFHAERVRQAIISGECDRGIGWDLYKSWHGLSWKPVKMPIGDYAHVIPINDGTDDIDRVQDWEYLKRRFE